MPFAYKPLPALPDADSKETEMDMLLLKKKNRERGGERDSKDTLKVSGWVSLFGPGIVTLKPKHWDQHTNNVFIVNVLQEIANDIFRNGVFYI